MSEEALVGPGGRPIQERKRGVSFKDSTSAPGGGARYISRQETQEDVRLAVRSVGDSEKLNAQQKRVKKRRRPLAARFRTVFHVCDIFVYAVAFFCFWTVAVSTWEDHFVYFNSLMKDLLLDEEFSEADSHIYKRFWDVASNEEFWQWLHGPLINGLFSHTRPDYYPDGYAVPVTNSSVIPQYYPYGRNVLVGSVVRMRQVRHKANKCEATDYADLYGTACFSTKRENQVVEPFGPTNAYTYSEADIKGGYRELGWLHYDTTTSGHVVSITGRNFAEVEALINNLENNHWVDAQTTAVTLEFNVYNADINRFCIGHFLFEFSRSGGVVPSSKFHIFHLFRYYHSWDYIANVCDAFFFIWTLVFIVGRHTRILINQYFRKKSSNSAVVLGHHYFALTWMERSRAKKALKVERVTHRREFPFRTQFDTRSADKSEALSTKSRENAMRRQMKLWDFLCTQPDVSDLANEVCHPECLELALGGGADPEAELASVCGDFHEMMQNSNSQAAQNSNGRGVPVWHSEVTYEPDIERDLECAYCQMDDGELVACPTCSLVWHAPCRPQFHTQLGHLCDECLPGRCYFCDDIDGRTLKCSDCLVGFHDGCTKHSAIQQTGGYLCQTCQVRRNDNCLAAYWVDEDVDGRIVLHSQAFPFRPDQHPRHPNNSKLLREFSKLHFDGDFFDTKEWAFFLRRSDPSLLPVYDEHEEKNVDTECICRDRQPRSKSECRQCSYIQVFKKARVLEEDKTQGDYLSNLWTLIEIFLMVCYFAHVYHKFERETEEKRLRSILKKGETGVYTDLFRAVRSWRNEEFYFIYMLMVLVIRGGRYLLYFKFMPNLRLYMIATYEALFPLFSFLVLFVGISLGFAGGSFLVFKADVPGYKSFLHSFFSNFRALYGDIDLPEWIRSDRNYARGFYLVYLSVMAVFTLNLIIGILDNAFTESKERFDQRSEKEKLGNGRRGLNWIRHRLRSDNMSGNWERVKKNLSANHEKDDLVMQDGRGSESDDGLDEDGVALRSVKGTDSRPRRRTASKTAKRRSANPSRRLSVLASNDFASNFNAELDKAEAERKKEEQIDNLSDQVEQLTALVQQLVNERNTK